MNERIKEITGQVLDELVPETWVALGYDKIKEIQLRTAELIVEATLTQVAERAYYSGDRAWSDELDRPWVQLEFGLGPLADAQQKAGIK